MLSYNNYVTFIISFWVKVNCDISLITSPTPRGKTALTERNNTGVNGSIYLVAKHLVSRRSVVRGEGRLSVLRDPGMADDLGEGNAKLRVRLDQLMKQISAIYNHNESYATTARRRTNWFCIPINSSINQSIKQYYVLIFRVSKTDI